MISHDFIEAICGRSVQMYDNWISSNRIEELTSSLNVIWNRESIKKHHHDQHESLDDEHRESEQQYYRRINSSYATLFQTMWHNSGLIHCPVQCPVKSF